MNPSGPAHSLPVVRRDDRAPPQAREARPSGKVLSIETGFTCNAYCGFCPQLSYRDDPEVSLDLSTEEIRERIRFGAQSGYTQIGFSGGETTIRKDFIELVAYTKDQGYQLIAVTTNGMMFAYPRFTYQVIKAGLTGINISLHGHTAKLHDAMMRTPGSFDLAIKGLENIANVREKLGVRLDMMSMCLASPQVIEAFPEQVRLAGKYGIKLHMLQPFLMTKGNTHLARFYLSSWEQIQTAIRQGAEVAKGHGGHVKLFNIPVCFFWDIQDSLERQWKKLDVFREHEEQKPGALYMDARTAKRATPQGYYRKEACETCDENCNGFRAEYYPQPEMLAEINASTDAHIAQHGADDLWFAGLELLAPDTMVSVLEHARKQGAKRVTLMTAAIGRAYSEQFSDAVLRLVDEVCIVPRGRNTRTNERHDSHGNFDDLKEGLKRLRAAPRGQELTLSATISLYELPGALSTLDAFVPAAQRGDEPWQLQKSTTTLADTVALGIKRIRVGLREGLVGHPILDGGKDSGLVKLLEEQRAQGLDVDLFGDTRHFDPALDVVDTESRLVRHRWTTREFTWIHWSMPEWLVPPPPPGESR